MKQLGKKPQCERCAIATPHLNCSRMNDLELVLFEISCKLIKICETYPQSVIVQTGKLQKIFRKINKTIGV